MKTENIHHTIKTIRKTLGTLDLALSMLGELMRHARRTDAPKPLKSTNRKTLR